MRDPRGSRGIRLSGARDTLPPLSSGRTSAEQIDRMFRHAEQPDLLADFD
jgi:hypothetical protein